MNAGALSKRGSTAWQRSGRSRRQRGELPGLVTLISRRGEVHVDAIGMKTKSGKDPMRRDTIFRQWGRPPGFPDGGGGLVSTADDFLAFSLMLLNKGKHGREPHPVEAVGRVDDDRSAHGPAKGRVAVSGPVGQPRLGLWRERGDPS